VKSKKIIPIIVFGLTFLVFVVLFNYLFVGRNSRAVSEISEATLPVLSIQVGENEINSLHGYTSSIDQNLIRDSIVPLETDYNFSVILKQSSESFASVSYIIYEVDNETVKETGISSFKQEKDTTKADVKLKDKLSTGKVYLVELALENQKGVKVRYYTRIKYGTELHFSECMEFIDEFHKAALEGGTEGTEYVNSFLESGESNLNNDLSEVDIHSNSDLICYAGMEPIVEQNFPTKVTEITEDLSSVEKQMVVSHEKSNGEKEYYLVTEYYKVRYSVSRMYLLDYERTQEEYFQYDAIDSSKNRFLIGTTQSNEKDLHTQNDCEMAAFVQNNQLWFYDYQSGQMVKVFSFLGEDYRDIQNNYNGHSVDILNMDKDGNIIFIVYGYMNRGSHEGENGICVYRFNSEDRVNEEVMFIPTEIPLENMKEDISRLAYLNTNDCFYFYLDGSIYKVDANKKNYEVVQANIAEDALVSSESGYFAIGDGSKITLTNMEDDSQKKIECGKSETMFVVGFIENDFVYGIANSSDVKKKSDGTKVTPMKKILIVNKDLEEIKTYEQKGVYIMKATTQSNMVQMSRASKSGNKYKTLVDDYIHYKEDSEGKISFEYSYNSDLYNQLYMVFPSYVYLSKEPKLVNVKESTSDNYKMIDFEVNEERSKICYVYTKGTLQGSYKSIKEAIAAAKEGAGVVVNSKQDYIWEKGVTKDYAKAANVSIVKAKKKTESFTACMQMMLKLNADSTSYSTLAKETGTPEEIMEKYLGDKAVNLTGCSLDDVLYYVSEGRPFIAKRSDGTYIVVMSYNSTAIRYIDPVKGESVREDRTKLQKDLKKAGNCFYSYTD
jgi:hypothetical protein